MNNTLNLIVMLTKNDKTVENAFEIFEHAKDSKAIYWGMKEEPLPLDEMKRIYSYMKDCGKKTVMEVVVYTEKEGLQGAKKAAECGCDILMGTKYYDSINYFCRNNNLIYLPFVGEITGRPSVLKGSVQQMIDEANSLIKKGVYGIDLLGYRYKDNAFKLNRDFVKDVKAPVCIAGSVNSFNRLDELKAIKPWAFTIGGAFFENKFGVDFTEQINRVCDYVNK